jgi:hypothetical protein
MPESPELLMGELLREFAPPCYVCDAPATLTMVSDVLLDGEGRFHFCDDHRASDSERFRTLTQVTYEELRCASLVRRCREIRVMPDHGAISECDYHGAVEGFCLVVNERLNRNIKEGSTWVRIKPPSKEELDAIRDGTPRLMPFVRSGSLAKVESIHYINGVRMVDIDIGGDMATYEVEAFKRAFIQAIDGHRWHLDSMSAFDPRV